MELDKAREHGALNESYAKEKEMSYTTKLKDIEKTVLSFLKTIS